MKMILYEKLFCYTRNDKSQRADNQLNQIKKRAETKYGFKEVWIVVVGSTLS